MIRATLASHVSAAVSRVRDAARWAEGRPQSAGSNSSAGSTGASAHGLARLSDTVNVRVGSFDVSLW